MLSLLRLSLVLGAAGIAAFGCGPGSPGGPTSGRVAEKKAHPLQSNDILAREPQTDRAMVKHILIGWSDLKEVYGDRMDPRAAGRSRWDAEKITKELFDRVAAGEPIEPLMIEHSEDPGSASSGQAYEVVPGSQFVIEFRQMALRLQVGETGKVRTQFGWHIIKRVK